MAKPEKRNTFHFIDIFHILREPKYKTEVPIRTTNAILQRNHKMSQEI